MTRQSRTGAKALLLVGAVALMFAVLSLFGLMDWVVEKDHPVRPVVEAFGWLAGIGATGIGGFQIFKSGKGSDSESGSDRPQPDASGVTAHGDVRAEGWATAIGGIGGNSTVNVNQAPADPPKPARD